MIYNRQTRRQFLRGGTAVLALPFLTSLWPRSAWGQSAAEKRFIAVWGPLGGYSGTEMYPTYAAATPTQLYPNHTIYRSPLTLSPSLGSISKIYSSALNPYLAKLNVIEGLDAPLEFTHGEATFLGHYRYVRGGASDNIPTLAEDILEYYPDVASIDQFLAYHPKFYKTPPVVRSVHGFDWYYAKGRLRYRTPNDPNSGTTELSPMTNPNAVFNALFGSTTPPVDGSTGPTNDQLNSKTLVDQVVGELSAVMNNRKISSADRIKLDNFATEIHELQQKLNQAATTNPLIGCVKPANPNMGGTILDPAADNDIARYHDLYTSVIAAGIKCGRTKIATLNAARLDAIGWEQDWHAWGHDGKTTLVGNTLRFALEKIYVPLLQKLDVEEADGMTYLDNSLVVYGNDNSKIHKSWSRPILTAGSAGGFLKTGNYVDYRRRGIRANYMYYATGEDPHEMHPGILYNQFLVTVLQAMGLSPSDYERPGILGYSGASLVYNIASSDGLSMRDLATNTHVHAHCINDAGKVLPLLVNT